jgi:hypothetical protein
MERPERFLRAGRKIFKVAFDRYLYEEESSLHASPRDKLVVFCQHVPAMELTAPPLRVGLAASPERAMKTGCRFRREGVIFLYVAAHALSSTILSALRRAIRIEKTC